MKSKSILITAIIITLATAALIPSISRADIYVYDNNDQYLGILLYLSDDQLDIFLPSLGTGWSIEYDDVYPCGDDVYFDSNDCSGTPYVREPLPAVVDLSNSLIGGFHKPDYNGKRTFAPGSWYDLDCQCQEVVEASVEYYPLTQVQMPFTTPIALPLKFKVRTKTIVVPLSD